VNGQKGLLNNEQPKKAKTMKGNNSYENKIS